MNMDCHWHTSGRESPAEIARAIDAAGIDRAVLFAPYYESGEELPGMPIAEANAWVARVASQLPDRVIGFGWIEPTSPGAVAEVERCVNDLHLRGFKMMPNHWYPFDEAIFPVYAKIEEVGVPVIFHSGVLYGYMDGSRFCRPVFYEALLHFPRLRFALSHVGWPWVDECLAVFGHFRNQWYAYRNLRPEVVEIQMYVDLTQGIPDFRRAQALCDTVACVDVDHLIWGSDATPGDPQRASQLLQGDRRILQERAGLPPDSLAAIFGGNLQRFLGPSGL